MKKILLLVADGVERKEVEALTTYFRQNGAASRIASLDGQPVRSWADEQWNGPVAVDLAMSDVRAADYDAVVIPSGELHVTKLLVSADAANVVRSAFSLKRVIAASRHGVGLLIKTGVVQGLTVTSCESLKTFVINAGSEWSSKDIVIDHSVITIRRAGIPKLAQAILSEIPVAEECRARMERRYGEILEHV